MGLFWEPRGLLATRFEDQGVYIDLYSDTMLVYNISGSKLVEPVDTLVSFPKRLL